MSLKGGFYRKGCLGKRIKEVRGFLYRRRLRIEVGRGWGSREDVFGREFGEGYWVLWVGDWW